MSPPDSLLRSPKLELRISPHRLADIEYESERSVRCELRFSNFAAARQNIRSGNSNSPLTRIQYTINKGVYFGLPVDSQLVTQLTSLRETYPVTNLV